MAEQLGLIAEPLWKTEDIPVTEHKLKTGNFTTHYQVWGHGPLRALFLHGGPGQAVADYGGVNFTILDPSKYTVVEVDQLGTGLSEPSVRKDMNHTALYKEIRGQELIEAITLVLDELKWDKVFLHGGSWGSSLAIWFAQMKPERVCGMVLRGVFTGTLPEMNVTYTKGGAKENPTMIKAFDELLGFGQKHGYKGGDNDAEAFVRFFRDFMMSDAPAADRDLAAWNWWVQENWVMGDTEHQFNEIKPELLEEARSVSFWESHIFYEMFWGPKPVNLLDVSKLPKVPIWIVQGLGDDVCPPIYAQGLEKKLKEAGFDVTSFYVEEGHKVTGKAVNNIRNAVRTSVVRFADIHK